MDTIETRELFTDGDLSIIGHMVRDDSDPNFPDFEDEADEKEFKRHFENGDFEYVGLIVNVHFAGAEIGEDSIWGTEHGYIGNDTNVDAWENVPANYFEPNSVQMGSTLNGVIAEAIDNAIKWAGKNGNQAMRDALAKAEAWADPNARKREVVMFRKWRAAPNSVIALFPCVPADNTGLMCQSFEHMGQHGGADLTHVMNATRPATAEEFAALKRELESAPYDYRLTVVQRTPHDAADVRRRALQRS